MNTLLSLMSLQNMLQNFMVVLGMLALLSLIYDWSRNLPGQHRKIFLGTVFGILGAASMLMSYEIQDGIFVDARNVIVAMSGIFIGPLAVCISAAIVGIARLYMGGVGVIPGLACLGMITLATSLIHIYFSKQNRKFGILHLLAFSAIAPIFAISFFFLLPFEVAVKSISQVGIWLYVDNFLWGMALGLLLLQDQKKRDLIEGLAASEQRADEALRAKSMFLAKMSHEIRTPLNAIMGFSELLDKGDVNSTQKVYLKNTLSACYSLLGIVNDILDFSSIEAGKVQIRLAAFKLTDMIANSAALVRPEAERKNLGFSIEFSQNVIDDVISDELRLGQIIINLLSNAVKFTNSGHVKLSVDCTRINTEHLTLHIAISDTGRGIDQEQYARIFEPFEQGDNSLTRNAGGTGLGLSITKNILDRLNGTITFESETDKGTTFHISVPVRQALPQSVFVEELLTTPLIKAVTNMKKAEILLVEDIEMNQAVLRAQLELDGYGITVVNNGKEAVQILTEQKFDLVLMDIQMPVMNGLEATEYIRNVLKIDNNALPIIAVTAHALPEQLKACLEVGMDDCLTKPVSTQLLYRKLDEWLGNTDYDPFTIPAPSESDSEPNPDTLLDETRLNEFISFFGTDHAIKLCKEFSGDIENQLNNVQSGKMINDGDLHNLASSAGNLGMNQLRFLCRSLMDDMDDGENTLSQDHAQVFETVASSSIASLEQYLSRLESVPESKRA